MFAFTRIAAARLFLDRLLPSCAASADALDQNMASTPVTLTDNPIISSKQIPLLCSVCPETPKFSDVSHLLTHIASKGHLHHETQTKLKAHQDIASAMALQQYEQWYREFEIETLLVERLRAKQVKEAARGRRAAPPAPVRGNRVSSFNIASY